MEALRSRRSLLILTLLLGLQFCAPLAARARGIDPLTDVPGMGLQEAEDKAGPEVGLEPFHAIIHFAVRVPDTVELPERNVVRVETSSSPLLVTTGLYPAAP